LLGWALLFPPGIGPGSAGISAGRSVPVSTGIAVAAGIPIASTISVSATIPVAIAGNGAMDGEQLLGIERNRQRHKQRRSSGRGSKS
jgi:hypothetical protein